MENRIFPQILAIMEREVAAISVIVPVYKAEKTISRCISSLQNQSISNWEAVCVDDGSPDNSGSILDRMAETDKRIKVLHVENGGVSKARNTALEKAKGKYIMFVDSDDFLHPQTMELCLNAIESDSSDLVAFTYNRKYRTKVTIRHYLGLSDPERITFKQYNKPEKLCTNNILDYATEYSKPKDMAADKKWLIKHCQPWRCLYSAKLIKGIEFHPGIIYEDFPWWVEVLTRTRKASILNLPLYYYYPNFGGFIHSAKQQYRIESLRTALALAKEKLQPTAPEQRLRLEMNFIRPFETKLASKEKKYGTKN